MRWLRSTSVLVAALVFVVVDAAPVVAAPVAGPRAWIRPVPGVVVRPFEPPKTKYGAGHLGVDFAAARGTPVLAAGPGTVAFAAAVGGVRHVVVAHDGGLRTSYSFLASIAVRRGEHLRAGAVLGTAGGTGANHDGAAVHLGLRSGATYLDPMGLFRPPPDLTKLVRLVPTRDRPLAKSGSRPT